MKRRTTETGFTLNHVYCNVCQFAIQPGQKFYTKEFFKLKEDLIGKFQDLHNEQKPTGCSGSLTIVWDNAAREIGD